MDDPWRGAGRIAPTTRPSCVMRHALGGSAWRVFTLFGRRPSAVGGRVRNALFNIDTHAGLVELLQQYLQTLEEDVAYA